MLVIAAELVLLLLDLAQLSWQQGLCFRKYPNLAMVNVQPFDRKSLIGEPACRQHCLSLRNAKIACRAMVYSNVRQTCDLYDKMSTESSTARLIQFPNRDYFEATGLCASSRPSTRITASRTTAAIPTRTAGPPFTATAALTTTPIATTNSPTSSRLQTTSSGTNSSSGGSSCAPSEVPVFSKLARSQLVDAGSRVIDRVSEIDCLKICVRNQDSSKNQVQCRSFNYYPSKQQCAISTVAVSPEGRGTTSASQDSNFYQKICVERTLIDNTCPRVINRQPQKILTGVADDVLTVSSFDQCVKACIGRRISNKLCQAAMFFSQLSQDNCVMSVQDTRSHPELLTNEEPSRNVVDYFETDCEAAASNRFLKQKQAAAASMQDDARLNAGGRKLEFLSVADHRATSAAVVTAFQMATAVSKLRVKSTTNAHAANARLTLCPADVCCPYLGSCVVGRRLLSDGRHQWCLSPCLRTK